MSKTIIQRENINFKPLTHKKGKKKSYWNKNATCVCFLILKSVIMKTVNTINVIRNYSSENSVLSYTISEAHWGL